MMQRLVTVIRGDLTPGYQIAQTVHAVAEYVMNNIDSVKRWYKDSNYVLSLAVDDERCLIEFCKELQDLGVSYKVFYEPDVKQMTSVAFLSTVWTDMLTRNMPLAGKQSGSKSKDGNVIRES